MKRAKPAAVEARPKRAIERPFTPAEMGEFLGVSVSTLAHWRVSGKKGPRYHKIGGRIRYYRADAEDFKAAMARLSTSDLPYEGSEVAAHP